MANRHGYETYQGSPLSAAEATSLRLADKATRLLEAGMRPDHPTHKHKWATGKEKWQAMQREGAIAAGVVGPRGRGRPKAIIDPAQKLADWLQMLLAYQAADERDIITHGVLVFERSELRALQVLSEDLDAASQAILGE